MIDLYSWATPNGQKIHIALEELGLPCEIHAVNIGAGEQFAPEFLKISPNNKIPAIVDQDGPDGKPISIFESGAILLYLAEKTKKLIPQDPRGRWAAHEWIMFQMGTVGPMFGQAGHFRNYAPEKIQYAIDRYTREVGRIYHVLDKRLGESKFLASDAYSVADISVFPWVRMPDRFGFTFDEFPNVKRWADEINARPAVVKGLDLLKNLHRNPAEDAKAREVLFGASQYQRR